MVEVLSPQGRWEKKAWKEVVVGDIVKVDNDRFFPADLVILSSSEPQGMCYIETSNLDGETNLKIRSALQQTCDLDGGLKLAEAHGLVECEQPNREIYDFKGNITLVWKLQRFRVRHWLSCVDGPFWLVRAGCYSRAALSLPQSKPLYCIT